MGKKVKKEKKRRSGGYTGGRRYGETIISDDDIIQEEGDTSEGETLMGKHLKSEHGKKKGKGKGAADGFSYFGNTRHYETKGHRGRSSYHVVDDSYEDDEDSISDSEIEEDGILYVPVRTRMPKKHWAHLPPDRRLPEKYFQEHEENDEYESLAHKPART